MSTLLLNRRYSIALIGCILFVLVGSGGSQQTSSGTAKASTAKHRKHSTASPMADAHTFVTPDQMQWSAAPNFLPAGAQVAVLNGDPGKPGPFTIRLKTPDGYKVAPHWHPTAENVTVISGEFHLGMGGAWDESKGTALPAGGYARMGAHQNHYGWSAGETIIQINGMGPFVIHYVKPSDDPRQKS
jgi:hypothetical protein